MPASTPVRDIMTTEVLSFRADDEVRAAMEQLVERDVDGAPVLDDDGAVVGMLTTGDLIVRESRLHFPTVISVLGGSLDFRSRHFDEDLEKALGRLVRDVMSHPAIVCGPDDTLQEAATLMHDEHVSRLAVVDDGRLAGIVSRGDVIRGMLREV